MTAAEAAQDLLSLLYGSLVLVLLLGFFKDVAE